MPLSAIADGFMLIRDDRYITTMSETLQAHCASRISSPPFVDDGGLCAILAPG